MINIPQPITDVTVYPYITAPIELEPVIKKASGTYSIGTLTTHVFYNMDLHGGDHVGKLENGGAYFAEATDAEGNRFRTHWMHCTGGGDQPTFGLTQNLSHPDLSTAALPASEGRYIPLEKLVDFETSISFKPPAIGTMEVDLGKSGMLIATRTGTPHVNGFIIENPTLPHFWTVGSRNISIGAKSAKTGKPIGYDNLTLVSATDKECVFLQQFI